LSVALPTLSWLLGNLIVTTVLPSGNRPARSFGRAQELFGYSARKSVMVDLDAIWGAGGSAHLAQNHNSWALPFQI
jgi:hypothetical protein